MSRAQICALLFAVVLVGCKDKKKEEAKTSPKGSGTAGEASKDKPPETPSTPSAGGAIAKNPDIAKLHIDSELVAGVDWATIRNSAVYKKLDQKLEVDKEVEKFKKECGFDPRDAVKRVTFGISNFEGEFRDKTEVSAVLHGVDKKALIACYEKNQERIKKEDDVEITRDGDAFIVKPKSRERSAGFLFTKDDELYILFSGAVDVEKLKKAAAGGSGPAAEGFAALYDKVGAGSTIYVVMNSNSKLLAKGQDFGVNAKSGVVQVTIGDGVSADVRVTVGSADDANNLAKGFQGQAQAIAGFVDKIEVKAEGSDVHATAAASLAKLEVAMRLLFGKDSDQGK